MSNALALFSKKGLPAHVRAFLDEEESNIADKASVPSLSYEGKTWTVVLNGEKKKLTKVDGDGDEVPVSILKVVVLDYAKRRGRAFYAGAYDPAAVKQPDCWSEDGVKPHDAVEVKQHHQCEGCPMSVKGSKVTEQGKAAAACSQHRMIVVVPANNLDHPPLRMKLAVTSDWDKQSPDWEKQHYYAFSNYLDFLKANGCSNTAAIVTKLRFDPNVAYPKVLFGPADWVKPEDAPTVRQAMKSDDVKKLLTAWTPAGVDGKPVENNGAKPALAPAPAIEDDEEEEAPKPKKAKAAPAVIDADYTVVDDEEEAPARKPKKLADGEKFIKPVVLDDDEEEAPAPKPKKAKPAPAPVAEDDDEDESDPLPPPPKAKKAKPAPVVEDDDEEEEKPAPKKAKVQVALDDDEDDDAPKPQKAKKAETAPVKPAKAATSGGGDLDSILDGWDD